MFWVNLTESNTFDKVIPHIILWVTVSLILASIRLSLHSQKYTMMFPYLQVYFLNLSGTNKIIKYEDDI